MQTGNLHAVRASGNNDKAIIFIHGFSGDQDDTWDRFPGFIGTATTDWDIYTLGYATTFLPDVVGVWSADPDLPIIATMFRTQLGIEPLNRYRFFAFIAHSMGGLVVQRALVDDPGLCSRLRYLVLFGTPSGGLQKAWWVRFWKRQLRNMARNSEFITGLRSQWAAVFPNGPSFRMWLEKHEDGLARRALDLYQHALDQALEREDHEQIYYHAINIAFLSLVAFDDEGRARQMAQLALRHCEQTPENVWNVATRAEASLYLGDRAAALDLYQQTAAQKAEPWQFASTSLQAGQIAGKLGLSPAGYDVTPLKGIQAAHDLSQPLSALQPHEQEQVLLEVAQRLKAAALSATERYTGGSCH